MPACRASVFSDFPLGNPAGKPYDTEMQGAIVAMGLDLLEAATEPRTTVQTPFVWSADESWKDGYMHVDLARMDYYRRQGEVRRAVREAQKRPAACADGPAASCTGPREHAPADIFM